MFLRCTTRKKDGKEHHYWSLVENRRVAGGRVVQRHVLYLGEINDAQERQWRRTVEVFTEGEDAPKTLSLFPEDYAPVDDEEVVRLRLKDLSVRRPRQWGACWLACQLYEQLGMDRFWGSHLPQSRKGTPWAKVLQELVLYRLLSPGSEWRLHRTWFEQSALADLLGADFSLAEIHKLYRCLDRVVAHKKELFSHLRQKWADLFGAKFEVLLYDLTSTYFESEPPFPEGDKRRYGYSRDKRSDCVQVVIVTFHEDDPVVLTIMTQGPGPVVYLPHFLVFHSPPFRPLVCLLCGQPRGVGAFSGAVSFSFYDDLVRVVGEAVEGALGEDRVGEERDPLLDVPVAGDDGRGPAVALDDDLVEVRGLPLVESADAEVVDDEEVRGDEAPHDLVGGVVGTGLVDGLEHDVGADRQDVFPRPAGGVAEGIGEHGLPDADGSHEDHVLLLCDEREREEIPDPVAVEGDGRVPVEVLEGVLGVAASLAETQCERGLLPPVDLVLQDELEKFLLTQVRLPGIGDPLGQCVEHSREAKAFEHGFQ